MFKNSVKKECPRKTQRQGEHGDVSQMISPSQNFVERSKYRIADLEAKLEMFGGMHQVEEDVLSEINNNSQRLEDMVHKVRAVMKMELPQKRHRKSLSKEAAVRNQENRVSGEKNFHSSAANMGFSIADRTHSSNSLLREKNAKQSRKEDRDLKEQEPVRLKDRLHKALEDKTTSQQKTAKYIKNL